MSRIHTPPIQAAWVQAPNEGANARSPGLAKRRESGFVSVNPANSFRPSPYGGKRNCDRATNTVIVHLCSLAHIPRFVVYKLGLFEHPRQPYESWWSIRR